MGMIPFLDPYNVLLADKSRKITWHTFFAFTFDFSMPFGLLNRELTFFIVIILMLSYFHACEPHILVFDKLLRALTTSFVMNRVLEL